MKSVCICGSNRFGKEIRAFTKKLRSRGVIVFEPNLYSHSGGKWDELTDFDKPFVAMGLTYDHFQKLRMADVCFIYNKDGYAGYSVSMEIGFAAALGKTIYALSGKDPDTSRSILFSGICATPEALREKLK